MFYVYCDGTKIYDQNTEDLVLIDPVLNLQLNQPGNFQFTMPTSHPYFDLPQKMLSRIWVVQDDTEIFRGRVIEESIDFYKRKTFYCEGELAFLNDSVQRPAEYHDLSVRDYFKTLIECHNEQVEEDKQFEIGIVLISDDNDSVFRYTNYNSTMEEMEEDLIDDFGGYIRVRNENGHRYLDYIDIDSYGARNDNAIRFGTNLLDYTQDVDVSEIATVIIPLGERLDESPIEALDMRLTIESVNGGSDSIESEEAVKTYGRIEQTVIWDDVTVASNLLEKGKKYLSDYQFENMVLEVSAVDLHLIDADVETAHLGDMLRVISTPHGLDRYFPLSQMTLYLDQPDQNLYVLGTYTTEKTLTSRVVGTTESIANVEKEITPTQVILNQAKEQATNLITAATHGYIVLQPNDEPNEILIMDTPSYETSTRVWRWNLNGLGYASRDDVKEDYIFGLAMTMDGAIVADYITAGNLIANIITAGTLQDAKKNNSWNLDTGELITRNGTVGGWTIGSNSIYYGISSTSDSGTGIYFGTRESKWQYSSTQYVKIDSSYGLITAQDGNEYVEMDGEGIYFRNSRTGNWLSIAPEAIEMYSSTYGYIIYLVVSRRRLTINSDFRVVVGNLDVEGDLSVGGTVIEVTSLKNPVSSLSLSPNEKDNDEEETADKIFDCLSPIAYEDKGGKTYKISFETTFTAIKEAGIDPDEISLLSKIEDEESGDSYGEINYSNIISLLVHEVQTLKTEVAELKEQLAN